MPSFLEIINDVVDAWYKLFNIVLDEYPPQIQKGVKREVQPKWFSNAISREMGEKMTRIVILLMGQYQCYQCSHFCQKSWKNTFVIICENSQERMIFFTASSLFQEI